MLDSLLRILAFLVLPCIGYICKQSYAYLYMTKSEFVGDAHYEHHSIAKSSEHPKKSRIYLSLYRFVKKKKNTINT